jgi:uncharacterized damage-inducible protein DinB
MAARSGRAPGTDRGLLLSPRGAAELVRYNRAVFERFARRVRRLPGTAAMRRRGIGHESLFGTLVHILNAHEVWLVYIVHGRTSDPELEALFADPVRRPTSWKGFDAYAKRVWSGIDATVRGLTPRALGRRVKVFWMPGAYTTRDAFLQTTLEEAHHLGEIIGALWQNDVEPPEMTWLGVQHALAARRRRAARRG